MSLMSLGIEAVERGLIPDVITRMAIRRLCEQRLRESDRDSDNADSTEPPAFVESMRAGPIAPVPEKANEQHYELPPEFFTAVLGPHRKYSSCFWPTADCSLAEAEATALEITCQRAELADGQQILELGCGRPVSKQSHYGSLKFDWAKAIHRIGSGRAWAHELARHHGGHEPVRDGVEPL